MFIYTVLAHIHFHCTAPRLGSSVRGDSCVCNLKNIVPCIPPLCFHLVLKVGCGGSEGPTSCPVYITPVLKEIRINVPVCQFLSKMWTSSYVTSCVVGITTSSTHFSQALRKVHILNVKPYVSYYCFSAFEPNNLKQLHV